ncbi:ThuA domain-containing protein [Yeosuana marina]|uniref:ThuA domain-containing protein n=1 Tax=Yeosuana marina TaxID=1565536 RepID=UPI0030C80396
MKKISEILIICFVMATTSTVMAQQFKVLLFTSPDRWHDRIIPIAVDQFKKLSLKHDFDLVWAQANCTGVIEDVFTEGFLSDVDVIVFLNSNGYDLSKEQMDSFKKFIHNGGGFVGIHAVSSDKDQELWFKQLVGRQFLVHPEEQTAVLDVVDKTHPSTMHLNDKWIWTDEWYSYGETLTNNLHLLLKVDEKTYDPDRTWGDNNRFTAMGDFHPIAWYQEFDGGRSFYTTLGHIPESYDDPWFLAHIYGGMYWAATGLGIDN